MSVNVQTLARPYARASFELAKGESALAEWSRHLAFSAQAASMPAVAEALAGPHLPGESQVVLLMPDGESADTSFGRFLAVLAENKRLSLLPDIAAQYEQLRADAERRITAHVRTAVALDDDQVQALKQALTRRLGRDVEIHNEIDPSVLGGAVIDAGDIVIDGSVRGRLGKLQSVLAH